jgi:hypothetical protein
VVCGGVQRLAVMKIFFCHFINYDYITSIKNPLRNCDALNEEAYNSSTENLKILVSFRSEK